MGVVGTLRVFNLIFNVIYSVMGMGIVAGAVIMFSRVNDIVSMRNEFHYRTDYSFYWPEWAHWIFCAAGIFVLLVSMCGFIGVGKTSKPVLSFYVIFSIASIVVLIAAAVVILCVGLGTATDKFWTDVIHEGLWETETNDATSPKFISMEERYGCCGAAKATAPRRHPLLQRSSCGTLGGRERYGCIEVVTAQYKMSVKMFCGATLAAAVVGAISVLISVFLLRQLTKKPSEFKEKPSESTC